MTKNCHGEANDSLAGAIVGRGLVAGADVATVGLATGNDSLTGASDDKDKDEEHGERQPGLSHHRGLVASTNVAAVG